MSFNIRIPEDVVNGFAAISDEDAAKMRADMLAAMETMIAAKVFKEIREPSPLFFNWPEPDPLEAIRVRVRHDWHPLIDPRVLMKPDMSEPYWPADPNGDTVLECEATAGEDTVLE